MTKKIAIAPTIYYTVILVVSLFTHCDRKQSIYNQNIEKSVVTTHPLQERCANYSLSSDAMLILFIIFGVVTTHPLQESCANYSLSSDAMLILFIIFGVVTTHLLQERCANYSLSSDAMSKLFRIFVLDTINQTL